jgi:hypothetical protein
MKRLLPLLLQHQVFKGFRQRVIYHYCMIILKLKQLKRGGIGGTLHRGQ